MTDWRDSLSGDHRDRLKKTAMPDRGEVMKATQTDDYFSDPGWIYEGKLDGERCLAFHDGNSTHLYSLKRKYGKHTIDLSNLDKTFFPDDKLTKGDLVNYYDCVAKLILPHVRDRPLTLHRGAPVAAPLDWYELSNRDIGPRHYTIRNMPGRLANKADPWRDMRRHAIKPGTIEKNLRK